MSSDFYRELEERFRAPQAEIRLRLEGYRPYLRAIRDEAQSLQHAFDIGCGRGEWLRLLAEEGFHAQGVDLDDSMLAACHEQGLQARNQDALEALREMADASLDLVTAFHVVEHLEFEYLQLLLAECWRVLRPNGLLILETPNSENLIVGTNNFYLDPTHQRPVPALFLEFLCQYHRFGRSRILRLQEDPKLHQADAQIGLWQVLYGVSPDYAVVAQKSVPVDGPDRLAALFTQPRGLDLPTLAQRHDQRMADTSAQSSDTAARLAETDHRLDAAMDQLARLERAHAAVEQLNEELRSVYASRSWRITQPMRDFIISVQQLDRPTLKNRAARLVCFPVTIALAELRHRHALADAARRSLARLPGYATLRRFIDKVDALQPPAIEPELATPYLGPRVGGRVARLAALRLRGNTRHTGKMPRLAFVSPLPPERTGIAAYSAELLPHLCRHFRVELIVEQAQVDSLPGLGGCPVRDADWLRAHASEYDAVLYHVGNAPFHAYMLELLEQVPGIVVLHDFYLSDLNWAMGGRPDAPVSQFQALRDAHGYTALADVLASGEAFRFPVNRRVLERAEGVIVHSDVSLRLSREWYGPETGRDWALIPHLREPVTLEPAADARQRLDIPADAFVVCSFGLLGASKLNHRLLHAWLASQLSQAADGLLVFVGQLGDDEYAHQLRSSIEGSGLADRIRITGWADAQTFRDYLAAADLAVQLRTCSRGETSGTVLDCMGHGLATIVNANGSMADLPAAGVHRLPDIFTEAQLVEALECFWRDDAARNALGTRARAIIEHEHAPARCAEQYRDAIARFTEAAAQRDAALRPALNTLAKVRAPALHAALVELAEQTLEGQPSPYGQRQLLLDITATCQHDQHTGVERVARALTLALLAAPPEGVRVEPVYLSLSQGRWHYRYASAYTAGLLGLQADLQDAPIDWAPGDRLIALDISGDAFVQASATGLYQRLRRQGVECWMLVHDLLPVERPALFPSQAHRHFGRWLRSVAMLDGAVCVTRTVAQELRAWLDKTLPQRAEALRLEYSHHGADVASSAPTSGLPAGAEAVLERLAAAPCVLMVGTLEPRKGYLQALDAFTRLWAEDVDVTLVIVGREGWRQLPDAQRRDIPQLMQRLREHPERGRRLFWLDGPSDEYLQRVYSVASGLLAASQDEGFGLPLIEAAQHGLPILARNIPVFREVAGEHARFFDASSPEQLAAAVQAWIDAGFTPSSQQLPWLTWQQSADNLKRILFQDNARPEPELPA